MAKSWSRRDDRPYVRICLCYANNFHCALVAELELTDTAVPAESSGLVTSKPQPVLEREDKICLHSCMWYCETGCDFDALMFDSNASHPN